MKESSRCANNGYDLKFLKGKQKILARPWQTIFKFFFRRQRLIQLYCSRSTFAGLICRARRTGPATASNPESRIVKVTAASTNGSCALA